MENAIKEKCPFKIDLGAVYSVDVRCTFFFVAYAISLGTLFFF